MPLINTARALDDARFIWRVNAAMIVTAAEKIQSATDPEERAYASFVLDNPMSDDRTMCALVAANPAVSGAVVVDENSTVNTEGVGDADIQYVVTNQWGVASARHVGRAPSTP